jgi:hypothetical protein
MDQLNQFLALLAQGLLIIALPILIAFLFQWLRQRGAEFRSRLTADQQKFIDNAVSFAVRAAEQSGLARQLQGGGAAKKQYAIKAAQDYLNRLNVKLDVNTIATLVEGEVHKQFSNAAPPVDDPKARSELLDKAVQTAVLSAEQSGLTGVVQNVAQQKKKAALDFAFKYLAEHGLRVDPNVVDSLIEAQVRQLKMNGGATSGAPALDVAARTQLLDKAAQLAVMAAEQSALGGVIQNLAQQKKAYAVNMATKYLAQYGLNVDPLVIDGLIEAAVAQAKAAMPAATQPEITGPVYG